MPSQPKVELGDWLTIRIDEALLQRLREVAERNDRTFAAEARRAIRQHVEQEEKK